MLTTLLFGPLTKDRTSTVTTPEHQPVGTSTRFSVPVPDIGAFAGVRVDANSTRTDDLRFRGEIG
jgi:hypothetical protein